MKERQLIVLIAGDVSENRADFHEALLRDPAARYVVIEAESGARALELSRARKPDCLILNGRLPDFDVADFLEKLAGDEAAPACAVVALVDADDEPFAAETMRSGAHDCLEKNRAKGVELRRAVGRAIEEAKRRRQLSRGHALIEKNRAVETDFAALRRETIAGERCEESWRVARAGAAGAQRAVVSRPENGSNGQTEEQLRLLKTAIGHSNESVIIMTAQLDPPGPRIVYVNQAFTKMTGYAPEEAVGETPHILQGPKTDKSALRQLCSDCREGKVSHGKMINYRRDGSEICLEWTAGPVRNERGDVTHIAAAQRDVTEPRRIEEELRRSEEEFRLLFEVSAVGMAQVSPEGRYLRVNRKFCQMLGYSEQELLNLTLHDVTHADDRENSAARLNFSFADGSEEYSIEKRYVRKDGQIIWVLINWTVVRGADGCPLRTVASIQDITERKLAEEALRAKEAQLRAILDHSTAVIFVKDLEGRYQRINRWYEILHGVTEAEVNGRTDYDLHPKEVADAIYANDREVISANMPLQFEERIVATDGPHDFIAIKFPLRDESGRPYAVCGIATDITERKRAERELRASQALNQAVLDSIAANIAVLDRDGNIIAVNEDWKRFAQENGAEAVGYGVGDNYLNVCRSADQGDGQVRETLNGIQAVLDGARPSFTIEYPCHSPHESRWFLLSATPLLGGRGGAVVIHTNITERKRAEEAIRQSESSLRQLADAMPQIVYTCGPDGLVVYGNQRWGEYVGVPVEQSIGRKWMEAIHPDDRESTRRLVRESGETGRSFETEHRLRRKDGQYRWHLARGIPIRDAQGRIVKWIGTLTDIHDRKEAEAEREELLARERAARAEAEHSAESIRRLQQITDNALKRLTLDDLLREMLARIRELLATDTAAILLSAEDGQSLSVRATIGFEDEAATGLSIPLGQGVAGSIAASRAPLVVEDLSTVEVINPVLRRKSRSLIGAPLIVEGRLIGVIHADTARTRRFTEGDVRLLQLAADRVALAIEHARLYDIERQARRHAEEANRMKDEFLTLVSHELRSPLNAVLGYAALLIRGRLNAQEIKHAAAVIERSGKAQAQLVDDLLDTARIISGKLRLELGPVDLVSVIEQAVQTIRPAADAKGILLNTDLPCEIGQITGDPSRLQQVVWNLLSNAVKFTPQGGRVEARLERADPYIRITVSDTGKGINPNFLPYIFDRFRQSDASGARRYGGLGLGLSLVKYLVELHGGTIEAASAGEGRGATFNVTLPVRAVATPLGESGSASATIKCSNELAGVRVLVVDDQDSARELIEAVLLQYGAEVVAASSAAEAYTALIAASPQERLDVIVSDIEMPGEDGYNLIRRVREWERSLGSRTPAVALTAYSRVEDRIKALSAGFQMHVTKPVEPAELALAIVSLIKRQDLGQRS